MLLLWRGNKRSLLSALSHTHYRLYDDNSYDNRANQIAKEKGVVLMHTRDPIESVSGADVVVTDTWISMGQEEEANKRKNDFKGYQVNKNLMSYAK